MIRKIAGWAIVVFLGFYLLSQPTGAAHAVHGAINGLHGAGTSLATFVNALGG